MVNWIKNKGQIPEGFVDIKLNCDETEFPGVLCVRYHQDPAKWDWQRNIGGIEITSYRFCDK